MKKNFSKSSSVSPVMSGRARDMRLAGVAEFEFRPLFLAIGAVDEKHVLLFLEFAVADHGAGRLIAEPLAELAYRATRRSRSATSVTGSNSALLAMLPIVSSSGLIDNDHAARLEIVFAAIARAVLEEDHQLLASAPHAGRGCPCRPRTASRARCPLARSPASAPLPARECAEAALAGEHQGRMRWRAASIINARPPPPPPRRSAGRCGSAPA